MPDTRTPIARKPKSALAAARLLGLLALVCPAFSTTLPFQDPAVAPEARVEDLLKRLTLDEKAGLMKNESVAVPRLGLPAFEWWNEGLHGVARAGTATVFPQAIGMAATWDSSLLMQVGEVVSTEARAKHAEAQAQGRGGERYRGLTLWSPNINIFRDPRWGRGQETYGEDPVLTGTLGSAYVQGLQGPDAYYLRSAACAKHLFMHSGPEATRYKVNVEAPLADFHETYTPAFRQLIQKGHVASVMTAYNAIYGEPASASPRIFSLLRSWNFDGYVVSDCGAVYCLYEKYAVAADFPEAEAMAVKAGLNLRCGSGDAQLAIAVRRGLLTEAELDKGLKPLLQTLLRLGQLDASPASPYASIPASAANTPANAALTEQTAEESLVLLKNEGLLPLEHWHGKTIAVIGPNADSVEALLGNYHGTPAKPVTILGGLQAGLGRDNTLLYARGCDYASIRPGSLPIPRTALQSECDCEKAAEGDISGLIGEFFANSSLEGKAAGIQRNHELELNWSGPQIIEGVPNTDFSVRWSGFLKPGLSGDYRIELEAEGALRLYLGEACIFDNWTEAGAVSTHESLPLRIADTKAQALRVEYRHRATDKPAHLALRWTPPAEDANFEQALALAKKADLVLFVGGITAEMEGEDMRVDYAGFAGGDRSAIELPAPQSRLVQALAATGKPLVLINLSGSAIAFGEAGRSAKAIVQAWYPGQSGGTAVDRILRGEKNPSGHLPVTFYHSTADLPDFASYDMKGRTYRYFKGHPEYPFGHGLSYSRFTLSSPVVRREGTQLRVSLQVRNTSDRRGAALVQAYVKEPSAAQARANRSLAAFGRIELDPGESRELNLLLPEEAFLRWDEGSQCLRRLPGDWTLELGTSSENLPLTETLSIL